MTRKKSLGVFLALLLVFSTQGWALAGSDHDHSKDSEPKMVASADWKAKLKAQLLREESEQGQEGRKAKVDAAMGTLMDEIMGHQKKSGISGPFTDVTAKMQMDRSWFLGPTGAAESVSAGARCPSNAPVKELDITAINVEITLNHWQDFHPGYMYVLTENVKGVREEERINREVRKAPGYDPGAVSMGHQTDLITPLIIRGNQGDCMIITLRNEVEDEDVGLHIHGSSTVIQKTGQPATSVNPDSNVTPGNSVVMEWYIQPTEQEGGHVFHSHAGREPGSLGLIGAFIVEPIGAVYLNPLTGKESKSGWQMMIAYDDAIDPVSKDFREFTLVYHEVGDESFRPLNRDGEMIPQRDPNTDAYRPSARAINFRSEPFGINNLATQEKYFHFEDESMAYSSYTFGDVPTTIPRSYMGDPAKFRLIHGGGEVFHSHHPHGGSIRWLRQPKADGKGEELLTTSWDNPVKFPVIRTISDRVDVEVIGPTEAVDLQTECGSGLCQQLAGDFLFHCHVAHHYVAGMWGYWRVYNTIQSGDYPFVSTDAMVPLKELPDRKGRIPRGVTSDKLVGKTMNWFDKKWNITKKTSDWSKPIPDVSIKDWVKMMLPPAGEPGHTSDEKGQILAYDASVWDYTWKGLKALGEKEDTGQFPNPKYKSPMPGKRPPILFNPKTGKTSWPHFKPHFGKRVPFARHHGGSPWLEPIHMDKNNNTPATDPGSVGAPGEETTLPPEPGEQGRWSLCPEGAGRKQYTIHFIQTPITMNDAIGKDKRVIDKDGTIYVLHEDVAKVRANPDLARPLAYRINIYDCLDVILKSEWVDNNPTNFQMSKINIHTHFIQFDNQASDGVISGFS
ncbi:MAG: multicopper oxidase domain-containing protein, partial [Nitrospiria bacterium]